MRQPLIPPSGRRAPDQLLEPLLEGGNAVFEFGRGLNSASIGSVVLAFSIESDTVSVALRQRKGLGAFGPCEPDAQPDGAEDGCLIDPLERVIEEERTWLMLTNSVLGCLQIALDPEAVTVTPAAYFPEVLALTRQFINKGVRQLECEEIHRLRYGSMSGCK
jgi:hypothetical protein